MSNLASLLEESTRKAPEKEAIIFGEKRFTFSQINAIANQVANGLTTLGIKKGDKVALGCLNVPYFPMVYYGILKTGATVVPINVLLKKDEIAYHLTDSDARAYFCFEGTEALPMLKEGLAGFKEVDECKDLIVITADPKSSSPSAALTTLGTFISSQSTEFETVKIDENDTAVILYTSGTTGTPKGAELTHSNMSRNAIASLLVADFRQKDTCLIVLPLFHSFGQTFLMNASIANGSTSVLLPKFEPDSVLSTMEKEEVTIFAGVPTMYWALLNHPGAINHNLKKIEKNMRICVSGGASLPLQVLKDFEDKFNTSILEGYGLSETSPVATFNPIAGERKPGTVGTAIEGVEVKILDPNGKELPKGEKGEIVIKGHNVMKGYYKRPEITKETIKDGWLYSGDIGIMDEDGYVAIVDRTKDLIIRGGFNVYPREVEEILMRHPEISLVAVIGVHDDSHGEEIKAFVVLTSGSVISSEELANWGKEQMAIYKYPRIIEIVDSMPMTATGKILKKELRKQ